MPVTCSQKPSSCLHDDFMGMTVLSGMLTGPHRGSCCWAESGCAHRPSLSAGESQSFLGEGFKQPSTIIFYNVLKGNISDLNKKALMSM